MSRTLFSLRRRRGDGSRHPVPSDMRDARVWCLALWFRVLLCSISAAASSISSDNADRFLKLASTCGCTVSTMVLSATRGLVLFRVIREGIGLTQRLSATGTCAPTGDKDAHPRTRASPEPTGHHQKKDHRRWRALPGDAQAACDFSLSASKFSPFFHRVR